MSTLDIIEVLVEAPIAVVEVEVVGRQGPAGGTLPASADGTFAANSDGLLPTQKAVKTYVDGRFDAVNAEVYKGVIDCSTNPNYPAANAGHVYRVSAAGKIGGASGVNVEVNDRLECHTDSSVSGNHATVGANWWIAQTNIDGAVTGPASSVTNRIAIFSGTSGKQIADGGKTLPTGAVVGNTDTQTLSGKSLVDSSTDFVGNGDATKKVQISADLVSAATTRVLTAPNMSGVIVTDLLAVSDVSPTLDLDFRDINGAAFCGNLTRATAGGYRQNNLGVLVPTVANEPVIDFSAGTALGTGFYTAYTNLALWSEDFTNAYHSKVNVTISSNVIEGPDGSTFDKIVENSSNAEHSVQDGFTVVGNTTYTVSIVMRAGERTLAGIFRGGASNWVDAYGAIFDLTTGTVVSEVVSNTACIRHIGNNYYLCSLVMKTVASPPGGAFVRYGPTDGISGVYVGDGVSGIYAGMVSITATAFPVPYVPTTSATVVRNADVMVISGSDFTDFFNPIEGTFFADVITTPATSDFPQVLQVDDGGGANRHTIFMIGSTGAFGFRTDVSSAAQADLTSAAIARGSIAKVAYAYKQNEFRAVANGGTVFSDVSGNVPSGLTRLTFGPTLLNSYLRRLIYWPKALTATELQRMTA